MADPGSERLGEWATGGEKPREVALRRITANENRLREAPRLSGGGALGLPRGEAGRPAGPLLAKKRRGARDDGGHPKF